MSLVKAKGEQRVDHWRTSVRALLVGGAFVLGCTPGEAPPPAAPPQPLPKQALVSATASSEPKLDAPSLEALAALTSVADLKPHVRDERVEARRVVAQRLATLGGAAAVPLLARLADDRDAVTAARALTALSVMDDGNYRDMAAQALERKGPAEHDQLLAVAQEQLGAPGLLALLLGLPKDPKVRWYRQKAVFNALEQLHDPRAADGLVRFTESKPHFHYQYRAAAELAQLGDPRAVLPLARRLRMDPLWIYSDDFEWEMALRRDDNERVVVARLIADVVTLHPDLVASLREQSEHALAFWATDLPSPHANSMRALAALGTEEFLPNLQRWAFPTAPLPKKGQGPPIPEAWIIALSAQRYVGQLRDPSSFTRLLANLKARPRALDVTMDALMAGDVAILGMSLRAVGIGAAHGLSEWGDPRAFQPLLAYVRDPKNNEQSRVEACTALAWVARERETAQLVAELRRTKWATTADQFRRQCLLEGLAQRAVHLDSQRLLPLLEPSEPHELRATAALAMAKGGIDPDFEEVLWTRTFYDVSGPDAVLALVLGGTPERAVEAVQRHIRDSKEPRAIVAGGVVRALEYLSQEDLDRGFLFTVLRNTDALARAGHDWVQRAAVHGLKRVENDNGPHSLTRTVLRYRLRRMTEATDAEQRGRAIRALWYLRERGTLLALAQSAAPDAELARTQHQLLLQPEAACDECPGDDY